MYQGNFLEKPERQAVEDLKKNSNALKNMRRIMDDSTELSEKRKMQRLINNIDNAITFDDLLKATENFEGINTQAHTAQSNVRNIWVLFKRIINNEKDFSNYLKSFETTIRNNQESLIYLCTELAYQQRKK